jgi:hypothetical protein
LRSGEVEDERRRMELGASTTHHPDIRGLPEAEPHDGGSSGGAALFVRESA